LSPEEFLESFNELVAFLKLGYHPGGEMMPTVAVALNALVQLNGTIQKFHRRKTAKRETVSTIEEEIQNTALLSTTTFCRLLAAFERALIIDRVTSGIRRSRADYVAGRIGKTKHTRSGKDLPTGRPRRIFRRDEALALKRRGKSLRAIAAELGVPHTTIAAELRGK
jgi:DNA invertase Pin-like site-specific DNA recombinase